MTPAASSKEVRQALGTLAKAARAWDDLLRRCEELDDLDELFVAPAPEEPTAESTPRADVTERSQAWRRMMEANWPEGWRRKRRRWRSPR